MADYIKFTFFFVCLFIFVVFGARSKTVEHRKEENYASMDNEYSHNFTNEGVANFLSINVTIMDGLEDVYMAEINQYG